MPAGVGGVIKQIVMGWVQEGRSVGSSRDGVGVLLEGFCSLSGRDWGLNLRDGEESDDLQVAYLPPRQEMGYFFWRHWTVTGWFHPL